MRSLPYVLRLSWAPWLILLLVSAVQVLVNTVPGQDWYGESLATASQPWIANHLSLALICALSAFAGADLFWVGGASIWGRRPRRWRVAFQVWLAFSLAACLPSLLASAWAFSNLNGPPGSELPGVAYLSLSGVASVCVVVLLGLTLGSLFGKIYGVLLAFAFEVALQLSSLDGAPLLNVGFVRGTGMTVNPAWAGAQAAFLGGVALLCLAALLLSGKETPRGVRFAVPVTVAVMALLARSVGPTSLVPLADPNEGQRCEKSGEVTVCMLLAHEHLRGDVTDKWQRIYANARRAGSERVPATLREVSVGSGLEQARRYAPGSVAFVSIGAPATEREVLSVDSEDVIVAATSAEWCEQTHREGPPSESFLAVQGLAETSLSTAVADPDGEAGRAAARGFDAAWDRLSTCLDGQ
ncbi:hypothetical protein KRX53_01755 [Dermabacteraceae bacterium TAE3-ERU5]|nr:hypothetical protein [Dermabacteraceae bacterium TAE3-ERU5]